MSVKKNCSKLAVHRAHQWHSSRGIFLCAGLTHEAQNPLYAHTPYLPLPAFISDTEPAPATTVEPDCASAAATDYGYSDGGSSANSCDS